MTVSTPLSKLLRLGLFILSAGSIAANASEPVTRVNVTTHQNVEGSGVDLDCTLWLPSGEGPFPVLVLVHGGGFSEGTPMKWAAWEEFASQGYVLLTTRYRLTGEGGTLRTFVQDNLASIKYLAAHAQEYKADMDRLAIMGSSAGGGIVIWMATLGMNEEYNPTWSPYSDQPVDIKACIAHYGAWQAMNAEAPVREQLRLHPERITAHFFLAHGTADSLVPPESTLLLYEALTAENLPNGYFAQERHLCSHVHLPVEAHIYEGFEHAYAYDLNGSSNQRTLADLLPFLARRFQDPTIE